MKTDSYSDIFTNTHKKTAPQALLATLEATKRGQVSKSQLDKAASEFESVFLGQMLQSMVPQEGEDDQLFGNQEGDEIFQTMMVDEYAKQISKSGGIGIAGYIQRELLGQQEVSGDANNKKYKLGILKMEPAKDAGTEAKALTEAAKTTTVATAENTKNDTNAGQSLPKTNDADALVNDIFNGGY